VYGCGFFCDIARWTTIFHWCTRTSRYIFRHLISDCFVCSRGSTTSSR
jgi:hypothetical protein